MGDLYWIWDKLNSQWTIGEAVASRWYTFNMDGSMSPEEFEISFIRGEKIERPQDPPLHV